MIAVNELTSYLLCYIVIVKRYARRKGCERRRNLRNELLGLWVRIPSEAGMFLCCNRYVFSGRGLCDELIARPEESYRLRCVTVCDLEQMNPVD